MTHMTADVSGQAQLRLESMHKPRKLWKVGDLARFVGVSRQAIHNYTLLGLIQEAERTPAGHRLFDDEAFDRLQRIERLKQKGLRLTEIAALLNRPKVGRGTRGARRKTDERAEQGGRATKGDTDEDQQ